MAAINDTPLYPTPHPRHHRKSVANGSVQMKIKKSTATRSAMVSMATNQLIARTVQMRMPTFAKRGKLLLVVAAAPVTSVVAVAVVAAVAVPAVATATLGPPLRISILL